MNKIVENLNKEIEFLQTHGVFEGEKAFISIEKEAINRFDDIYLEISNKETDELIKEGNATLLNEKIKNLLQNKENYLYVESKNFELIRMESLVLEKDDLFDTYEAIFGLYAPKKAINQLKDYFKNEKFSMVFNDKDGLWEINVALDTLPGFSPENTLEKILTLVYEYIFQLQTTVNNA